MTKIIKPYFLILLLCPLFAGCTSLTMNSRKETVAVPKVQLHHYSTRFEFSGRGSLSHFHTMHGQRFSDLLKELGPNSLSDSQIKLSANLAPRRVDDLSLQLEKLGFRRRQISQAQKPGTASVIFTFKIYRTTLVQSDCYDEAGQYRFGCAVNWNRAASLHQNMEIEKASAPGVGSARLERSANHRPAFRGRGLVKVMADE